MRVRLTCSLLAQAVRRSAELFMWGMLPACRPRNREWWCPLYHSSAIRGSKGRIAILGGGGEDRGLEAHAYVKSLGWTPNRLRRWLRVKRNQNPGFLSPWPPAGAAGAMI